MNTARKTKNTRFPKKYMTLTEASEMSGLGRDQLYHWFVVEKRIETRRIPGFTGKRTTIIFKVSDFENYLDKYIFPARERVRGRAVS